MRRVVRYHPKIKRRKTRPVWVGNVAIGGDNPVRVQSMSSIPTWQVKDVLYQIQRLYEAGCEIVRVAIPDEKSVKALKEIVEESPIPVVADLHFAGKLGLLALEQGIHGLRINPGTFKDRAILSDLIKSCKEKGVCLRIGINAGSLEAEFLQRYKYPTPQAMVESALRWVNYIVERHDYTNLKVSLKSSNWWHTVQAYQLFAKSSDFPLHVGVTEAGGLISGTVKSTLAMGHLFQRGIGDTIRVSLTADPVEEVQVAYEILRELGLRALHPEIIACPTCGRCEIDLMPLYEKVLNWARMVKADLHLAVMGCVVNGPGEARLADLGIAGGKGVGLIFREGKIIRKVKEENLLPAFFEEVQKFLEEHPERLIK